MIAKPGERLFDSVEARDAFIDENFPKRKAYGDGSIPGFYELPGRRYLSVAYLKVGWGELSEEEDS